MLHSPSGFPFRIRREATNCGFCAAQYFDSLLAKGRICIAHEYPSQYSYGRTSVVNGTNIAVLEVVSPRWILIWFRPSGREDISLFLLPVQAAQSAVIFLRYAFRRHKVRSQTPGIVGRVHDKNRYKKHPLVAGLQVLQKRPRLRAVGGQIGRNDVHVITRPNRFHLLLNLHGIQVRDFALDVLNRRALVNGLAPPSPECRQAYGRSVPARGFAGTKPSRKSRRF